MRHWVVGLIGTVLVVVFVAWVPLLWEDGRDPCDQPGPANLWDADYVVPPGPALLVRDGVVSVDNRVVAGVEGVDVHTRVRAALAERRATIIAICHKGGAAFEHALMFIADPDLAAGVAMPLLEDARAEGFEIQKLVVIDRREVLDGNELEDFDRVMGEMVSGPGR